MLVVQLMLGLVACSGSGDHPPCSCIQGPRIASRADATASLRTFAAVFEGTVVRVARVDGGVAVGSDSSHVRRRFRWTDLEVTVTVRRRWKGDLGDTVTMRTPASTTMCGSEFVEGRAYLVFALSRHYDGIGEAPVAGRGEIVFVTKCTPTAQVGRESARIADLLGRGLPPSP
jgi:hypothetical protein